MIAGTGRLAAVSVSAALALLLALEAAPAQTTRAVGRSGLGDLGSSKEPIKIDADRLDVFDKEGRAVFSGNVVAVQGDSTMNCSAMNVFYEGGRGAVDCDYTRVAARCACAGPPPHGQGAQTAVEVAAHKLRRARLSHTHTRAHAC